MRTRRVFAQTVTYTHRKEHLMHLWPQNIIQLHNYYSCRSVYEKGVEIDTRKKILIYPDGRNPVPVNEDHAMAGKGCWKAMNYGNQGEGLIEGNVLDYVMGNIMETKTK